MSYARMAFLAMAVLLLTAGGLAFAGLIWADNGKPQFASQLAALGFDACMQQPEVMTSKADPMGLPSGSSANAQKGGSGEGSEQAAMTDQQLAARMKELRFNATDTPGTAFDEVDGTASIFARLDRTQFSFDGQDIKIHMSEAPDKKLEIRGRFENGLFLRQNGATLTKLRFLDRDISIKEIEDRVRSEKTATIGTVGNDLLEGRSGKPDVLYGDAGCDTFVADLGSGEDSIKIDKTSAQVPDLIKFKLPYAQIFERANVVSYRSKGDQYFEFIELRPTSTGPLTYLSKSSVTVTARYESQWAKKNLLFAFKFQDREALSPAPQRLVVRGLDFSLKQLEAAVRACSLIAAGNAVRISSSDWDAAEEASHKDRRIMTDIMAHRDFDYVVLADRRMVSRDTLLKNNTSCDFDKFMKSLPDVRSERKPVRPSQSKPRQGGIFGSD
jgi:hypothetical protein